MPYRQRLLLCAFAGKLPMGAAYGLSAVLHDQPEKCNRGLIWLFQAVLLLGLTMPTHAAEPDDAGGRQHDDEVRRNAVAATYSGEFIGFRGNDAKAIAANLNKRLRSRPEKSEFETLTEFDSRYSEWESKLFGGGLLRRNTFVISIKMMEEINPYAGHKFDAESSMMNTKARGDCGNNNGLVIGRSVVNRGGYVGQNAYGVKRQISKQRADVLCLRFTSDIEWMIYKPVKMSSSEAKDFVDNGVIGLTGDVVAPFVYRESTKTTPTIDEPLEIEINMLGIVFDVKKLVVFNPKTGKVFVIAHRE